MNTKWLVGVGAVALLMSGCVPEDNPDENCEVITSEDVSGGVTLASGCYLAEESVSVGGGMLTLEPGVTIQFARDTGMTIAGRDGGAINSLGSQEDPVTLTGAEQENGFWRGLYLDNSTDSANVLDYTVIEYGGGSEVGSGLGQSNLAIGGFTGTSVLAITNSTFRFSAGHGIELESDNELLDFAANTFEGNEDYAMSIPAEERGAIDADSTFTGDSAESGVEVFGGSVVTEGTWAPLKADAYTTVTSSMAVETTLEIAADVELHFADNVAFNVDGRGGGVLITAGTEESPVLFTGVEQSPGAWRGIYIDNTTSSDVSIDHTIVEYGGSTEVGSGLGQSNLGIGGFTGTSRISVTNSVFRNSAGHGIEVENENENEFIAFSGNSFEGNADYALSIPADLRRMVDATNEFAGDEAISYVEIQGGSAVVDGTWPDLAGDAFTSVTGGMAVSARLVFDPGVELHFGDNVGFTVAGRDGGILIADGEEGNEIVFTRLGGVQWKGIYFDNSNSSENLINNAVIEYGGFSEIEDHKANLFIGGFVGSTALTVTNSAITNSDGVGVYIEADSAAGVNQDIETVNTFADNAGADVVFE